MSRAPQFQNCTTFDECWSEFYAANDDYFRNGDFTDDQRAKIELQVRSIFLSAFAAGAVVFMAKPGDFLAELKGAADQLLLDQKDHIRRNPLDDPSLTQGPAN